MILKILPFLISVTLVGGGITAAVIVNQEEDKKTNLDSKVEGGSPQSP